MNKVFSRSGSVNPGRSVFNLSYEKKFDADMGLLYPVMCDEVVPGDVFDIGCEVVLRAMPMVTPILHRIDIKIHYFFVPYRILDENWEDFITGGADGDDTTVLPTWNPTASAKRDVGTLWDYLYGVAGVTPDADSRPLDYPRRAYFNIWNEYYRDQNTISEIDPFTISGAEDLQYVAWEKDYFTASLPWQQRGTAAALPVSIISNDSGIQLYNTVDSAGYVLRTTGSPPELELAGAPSGAGSARFDGDNTGLAASPIDVNDLRLSFQIQRWQERNARAGVRYNEFLKAHYGVAPRDERLQRPEYIGGSMAPVIVSEVLQTSEDGTTPQGTLRGHGITVDRRKIGKYRAKEFGVIMGLMSIRPKPAYHQGINRQWFRKTRFDFYSPEFANLSEQAIEQREIYLTSVKADNETIFGYIGRYDEMRVKQNMIHGLMHDSLTFQPWHLARDFSAAPTLSKSFLELSDARKDFLAAPDEPAFVVNYANIVRAVRPMPALAEPGLTDH